MHQATLNCKLQNAICTSRSMASILSLTDDCLFKIVSYIDDPGSFHSFILTCRRFPQVTRKANSILHTNLLKAKAEFFIKSYIVHDIGEAGDDFDKFDKLRNLLYESAQLIAARGVLTYDRVMDVWQRNGPVAAKLFTWIRNQISSVDYSCKRQSVTLYLPKCELSMVINCSFYREDLKISVTCGDICRNSEVWKRYSPEDYLSWKKEEVTRAVQPMKAVIDILQGELGETVPSITHHFFLWLCFYFPDMSNLLGANRLSFKDTARNMKPTVASVQSAIDQCQMDQQFEAGLQNLVSGWESDEKHDSVNSKIIAEMIRLLSQRSEAKILENLLTNASRFWDMYDSDISHVFGMTKLPKLLQLDLLQQTSITESTYHHVNTSDRYVESKVYFACPGGEVMKVCGWIVGCNNQDGMLDIPYSDLKIEFTLPNGTMLKSESENEFFSDDPLETENPSPVTKLLLEAFSQNIQGQNLPVEVDNRFSAIYFLTALGFLFCMDTEHRLIPPLSDEEWFSDFDES